MSSDTEWSDWSETDVADLLSSKDDECSENNVVDVRDEKCGDIPLIQFTKNKRLLYKNRIRRQRRQRSFQKYKDKSVKKAIKTLKSASKKSKPKVFRKIVFEKKPYNLRGRKISFKKLSNDVDFDDSDNDETFKPTDSTDSESTTSETSNDCETKIEFISKTQLGRDKCWKRKGKKIKEKGRKKPRIVSSQRDAKPHSSGPWKMRSESATSLPSPTKVINQTKKEYIRKKKVLQYHSRRLDNLLTSNGLKRISVYPDGNCFFTSVLPQIQDNRNGNLLDTGIMRDKTAKYLSENEANYISFLHFPTEMSREEKSAQYQQNINELKESGHWNTDLADLMPLAIANIFQRPLRIYSSRIENAVYDIKPDIVEVNEEALPINIALFSVPGQEHYDAVEKITESTASKQEKTPRTPMKPGEKTPSDRTEKQPTPRKRAEYVSPVKKQLFRKKKREEKTWKKTIRKHSRDHGLSYVNRHGKQIEERKYSYRNCDKCRFKCSHKISEDLAKEIFQNYWQLGSYTMQRSFICKHVEQTEAKRCKTKIKSISNAYFLPIDGTRVRVCKSFFLGVICIGRKTVDFALKQKSHGIFAGSDKRGKHPSGNKILDTDKAFISKHIQYFPTVESHYTRKDSYRKYLSPKLSLNKMYELYRTECIKEKRNPCKVSMYRKVFCSEFNLAFHKPKKDQCTLCYIYKDKKENCELTPQDEAEYIQHMKSKENARQEKANDKQRAQSDKSFVVCTFDLEAVLPTPFSKVGDLYYKRCLSTYNLSVYSLGDKKATCYLWDETNGGRGSCEIGTCLLLHINSIAEKSNVRTITYFSDTCGGQNRNQFVCAGLLYALHKHNNLQTINHKFFERGHSAMECDSVHSSIERKRRDTNIYLPSQWDTIVSMARKNDPYIVIPLCHSDFYDLKSLRKNVYKNMKISESGQKVNWLRVKWIQVNRENPHKIFLNYSFDKNTFITVNTRTATRGRYLSIADYDLLQLYSDKIGISEAKKKDLLSMCKSGIIPKSYHAYYELLPVNKKAKDKLTEPDMDEEDGDTDCEN